MLPPAEVERLQAAADFLVWPENWDTVVFFGSLSTQWRFRTMPVEGGFTSRPTGLEYTAALAMMDARGIKDRSGMLDKIMLMENTALEVFACQT